MHIPLDRQNEIPLYRQIAAYLHQNILSGGLPPDTRLPATRQLARDLGVNRITVENAYASLEAEGLVFSQVGSGTYVLPPGPLPLSTAAAETPWPLWQEELLTRNEVLQGSLPEDSVSSGHHLSIPIDFSSGIGDKSLFPTEDFRKVIQTVMRRDGNAALEYGDRRGYAPLRCTIAHVLASQGLPVCSDNILITSGSQQALALVSQMLLKADDTILVESPTYAGGLSLFRALRLKVVGIPTDENGMQVEKLENLLQRHHPRLIYTIPNFQNPTGACLNSQRRHALIALAERYNVPILEDDYVGDLRYEGYAQPTLKAFDPGGRVIYVSTFSKMLMPGLRVGFLAADGPVYNSLVRFKILQDLATSNLIQRALEAYVTVGGYQAHLRRSCQVYRKRRDAMLQAVHRYLPAEIHFTPPQGGLFLWLNLPPSLSSSDLLPLAREEGVVFAPGAEFFTGNGGGETFLRLNFAANPPEIIEEGIRRLGKAVRRLESRRNC